MMVANTVLLLLALYVVPVIVLENKGLFMALAGSVRLMKNTWNEMLGCTLIFGAIILMVAAGGLLIGQSPALLNNDYDFFLQMSRGQILMTAALLWVPPCLRGADGGRVNGTGDCNYGTLCGREERYRPGGNGARPMTKVSEVIREWLGWCPHVSRQKTRMLTKPVPENQVTVASPPEPATPAPVSAAESSSHTHYQENYILILVLLAGPLQHC